MHCIIAAVVGDASEEFLAMGFNVQSARVMIALHVNKVIRAGEIARLTCIETSTLSHMLARLAREKLIIRKRDANDFRSIYVRLTKRGERLARECYEASLEHERRLLRGVSPSEVRTLRDILALMSENVGHLTGFPSEARLGRLRK